MPSSIPYDPSLVLANIVDPKVLNKVKAISTIRAEADIAQEALNAVVATRRSLDMTRAELLNLGIDVTDLDAEIEELNKDITKKAAAYCAAKIKAEKAILELPEDVYGKKGVVDYTPESPVDYVKTEIKTMPLASDSINMDVQYFSLDTNMQDSSTFASQIGGFVSASTAWMGAKASSELSTAAQTQTNAQTSKHKVSGTLVLSVSCKHKNASLLAPFFLNVDKGIEVWNYYYPEKENRLDPTDLKSMTNLTQKDEDADAPGFSIVSGVTYGSSFVGMVHMLNTTETNSSQSMDSIAMSLQAQMSAGGWFANASGGFGVNTSFSNAVKSLLSTQNVTSHVTMICMGAVPSMTSNQVQIAVEKFDQSDPAKSMEALASLQNATASNQESVAASAEAARTGGQMASLKTGQIQSTISALAQIDDGQNKVLDINSMMTALEDYVSKVPDADTGVPLNYYIKKITKEMLAQMWVAKYFPDRYMAIKYDDSEPKGIDVIDNTQSVPKPFVSMPLRQTPGETKAAESRHEAARSEEPRPEEARPEETGPEEATPEEP
ncbi:unnamed protein product [Clonostachys chloroleuca]|uniref:Uncharacterized protein n=1 Tax=Clonostachys chloroleuca TaxID=1926264 RepID=A0AA35M2P7_9HYPO|nr:unnamed protein product [Clonostachys chloroleuca]